MNEKLITPNQRIIGSAPSKPTNENDLPFMVERSQSFNAKAHEEYNRNIYQHPKYIKNFIPRDNHMLIRLFKLEENKKSDGGLILEDFEYIETPGGQMKARISENPYQTRAVVVKVGHLNDPNEYQKLLQKEGQVVRLQSPRMGGEFDTEPSKKGIKKKGYFLVHVGLIIGIETEGNKKKN